jgi:hypothetical protein
MFRPPVLFTTVLIFCLSSRIASAQRSFREQLADVQQASNMQIALLRKLATDERFATNMRNAVIGKRFGDAVTLAAEAAGVSRESFTIHDAMPNMETTGAHDEPVFHTEPLGGAEREVPTRAAKAVTAIYACTRIRASFVSCTRIQM